MPPTPPVSIRRARPQDLAAIVAFDAEAADPGRRAWLAQALERREVHLLTAGDQRGAYGVLDEFFGHPFVSLLYVAPARRRQGLGEALLWHLGAAAPRVFSSTNLSNAPMHALFRKQGWEVSGLLNHLDEGDPEVVYVKRSA